MPSHDADRFVSTPHRMHQAELQHAQYDVVRLKLQFNSEERARI
jgi:hypothetical protein